MGAVIAGGSFLCLLCNWYRFIPGFILCHPTGDPSSPSLAAGVQRHKSWGRPCPAGPPGRVWTLAQAGFPPPATITLQLPKEALAFLGEKQQMSRLRVQWSRQLHSTHGRMQLRFPGDTPSRNVRRNHSSVPVLGSTRLFLHSQHPLWTSHPPPPALTTSQAFSRYHKFSAFLHQLQQQPCKSSCLPQKVVQIGQCTSVLVFLLLHPHLQLPVEKGKRFVSALVVCLVQNQIGVEPPGSPTQHR